MAEAGGGGGSPLRVCCFPGCGKTFQFGNNAQPVMDGWCCDDCNVDKVLSARLAERFGTAVSLGGGGGGGGGAPAMPAPVEPTCCPGGDVRGMCFFCVDREHLTEADLVKVLTCPRTPDAVSWWLDNTDYDIHMRAMVDIFK